MAKVLYRITQKILLSAMYILMYGFADFTILGKNELRGIQQGPCLVVANHKGVLDPPLVGLCFPFFSRVYPLRFMTKDRFFLNVFSRAIFLSLGCFPAYSKQGIDLSLKGPREALAGGEVFIIFPEGRVIKEEQLAEPKVGVGILAKEYPDVPIVPVAIKGTNHADASSLLFKRPKISLLIGKPHTLREMIPQYQDKDASIVAKEVFSSVAALFELL